MKQPAGVKHPTQNITSLQQTRTRNSHPTAKHDRVLTDIYMQQLHDTQHNCAPTHRQCSKYITHTRAHTHTQTDTTETMVISHSYAMYGYAGYAKVSYVTWLRHVRLRNGYTKFGYATSLRHTRLRNMLMPPMVMSVTPNSVMPHGYIGYVTVTPNSVTIHSYAICGYVGYATVTPISVTPHGYATYSYAGYAKHGYAT